MQRLLAASLALLLCSTVSPAIASDSAEPETPATLLMTDPLEELYVATYYTVEELTAQLPHGHLAVAHGVLASFVDVEARTAGVIVGDIELHLDRLPVGPGVLNLFRELGEDKHGVTRKASQAYYSVAATADSHVEHGYVIALRSWDELYPTEQDEFIEIYLQAVSDGWIETGGVLGHGGSHWAGGGQPGGAKLRLRYPVGKEIFAAVWDMDGDRWDYRVNADASEFTITDYYRSITYIQDPWTPEEGDLDEAVEFARIHYSYAFWPATGEGEERQPGNTVVSIHAEFTLSEDRDSLGLVSYPWLEFTGITDWSGTEYASHRGGEGQSDWMLFVDGDFHAGETYELSFDARGDVPDTYGGIGYGGVYRFDTVALWPGEDHRADIEIEATLENNDWNILGSAGADVDYLKMGGPGAGYGPLRDTAAAHWPAASRNQMLVATMFPSVSIPTSWGELLVYAPPELIGGVVEMESIAALGEIIKYYNELWGDRGVTTQPVFLVPDEHGVQAFEDAGLIFILGGDRTGIPLIAHETAHLWWGYDVGGPRWFFEGMANYGAAKFVEHYYGAGGPAEGRGDPLFYRRYMMNFSLGFELPLSLDRRDAMDDTAAVYHNSAAFLLTCDATLPGGLDPVLATIWDQWRDAPALSHEQLRGSFRELGGDELLALWESYAERGEIPAVVEDDPTFRRFEFTPARENYVKMLRWLTPAYKKQAVGDYGGALYCAKCALDYRSEPKDFLLIAELTYKAGALDEAWERCAALLENPATDEKIVVKLHWLFSRIHRQRGEEDLERLALGVVISDGPAADLLYLTQQATARLAELDGEAVDAESGATPGG